MTNPTLPKLGLHPRTPERVYRQWPAAHYSSLKHFKHTPAHVYQALVDPPAPTAAMDLGSAGHVAVLEPEQFETRYVRGAPGDLRLKANKAVNDEIKAENPNKELVRDADWPKILRMRDVVWAHPRAEELLSGEGLNELSALWEDPDTGLACKLRVDRLTGTNDGWPCVVDYKTFGEFGGRLTPYAVERVINDRSYHIQGAHYLNGFNAIELAQRRYILILQEKDAPFCVRCVELDAASIELGKRQVARWLRRLKRCQDRKEWPGWSTGFDVMGVPSWAYSQEEEDDDAEG